MGVKSWIAKYFNKREHAKNLSAANTLDNLERREVAMGILDKLSLYDYRLRTDPTDVMSPLAAIIQYCGDTRRQAIAEGVNSRSDTVWLSAAMTETWAINTLMDHKFSTTISDLSRQFRIDLEQFISLNLTQEEIIRFQTKDWNA